MAQGLRSTAQILAPTYIKSWVHKYAGAYNTHPKEDRKDRVVKRGVFLMTVVSNLAKSMLRVPRITM